MSEIFIPKGETVKPFGIMWEFLDGGGCSFHKGKEYRAWASEKFADIPQMDNFTATQGCKIKVT